MAKAKSRIQCDIDFEKHGVQRSILRVVHSDNQTPWGVIPVPVAVISGGKFDRSSTVLLSAGNHGDEYEGQLILRKLLNLLKPEELQGRIIILPALNYPAVLEKSRVSNIDGVNMNRAFPGDPDSTPTYTVAHYVETELLPLCHAAADLHSGGKVSSFLPCSYLRHSGDTAFMRNKLQACDAFAAPVTVVVSNTADHRSLSAACDRNNVIMVATELAGSAHINLDAMKIGMDGVKRYLAHFGIIDAAPEAKQPTRYVETPDSSFFVWAVSDGIFEPSVKLGDTVNQDQIAGYIYPINDPFHEPDVLRFSQEGEVVAMHTPATVHRGQYLFQIARQVESSSLL